MEEITVTGKFFDVAGRPLTGKITFSALPEYIVHRKEQSIFAGPVTAELDAEGGIEQTLIASDGWVYEVRFDLKTQDGKPVPYRKNHIKITESGPLPDFMSVSSNPPKASFGLYFTETPDNEVIATNYRLAPDDSGAIVVPIS